MGSAGQTGSACADLQEKRYLSLSNRRFAAVVQLEFGTCLSREFRSSRGRIARLTPLGSSETAGSEKGILQAGFHS